MPIENVERIGPRNGRTTDYGGGSVYVGAAMKLAFQESPLLLHTSHQMVPW